jgi:hypothetical protein
MVLTASQIEIGRAHLRAELTYCNDLMQQREVFLRRDGHEVPVPVPQTNQKVSSASASSASAFDDDMAASTMCADANDKYMITEEAVWSEYMTKTQAASSSSSSSATAVPLPSVAAAKP